MTPDAEPPQPAVASEPPPDALEMVDVGGMEYESKFDSIKDEQEVIEDAEEVGT